MKIDLIAIDVDGTLLDDQHNLSQRNADAIAAAIEQGVQVVLATGRMRTSCEWLIERLGLTTPGIFVQGLSVQDSAGKLIYSAHLEKSVLEHFCHYAIEQGLSYVAFGDGKIYAHKRDELTDIIIDYDEPAPLVVERITDYAIYKIIIFADPAEVPGIRTRLVAYMNGSADVLVTQPEMVEIMPTNTSKGHSLRWLSEQLGVDLRNTMAIGNAENDLAMLNVAGLGVAVGNSSQVVLDSAEFVTASSNESGVADAIERFVLKQAP